MSRHKLCFYLFFFVWVACLPRPAAAASPVSGAIAASTTWDPAGSPYVITSPVTVNPGVTLTVAAGTVVRLGSGGSLLVSGTLSAVGTSVSPIHFTDLRDDLAGNTGNADPPAPGGWQNITVSEGGNAVIDYCTIRYGGGMINTGSVYKYGSGSLAISNSTVSDSNTYGINYVAGMSAAGNISITNTTISNNGSDGINLSGSTGTISLSENTISGNTGSGLFINSGSITLLNNTFNNNSAYGMRLMGGTFTSASGNSASGNAAGPVRMLANYLPSVSPTQLSGNIIIDGGILSQSFSMNVGTPYVVAATFDVAAGKILTVPAGTVVKFGSGAGMGVTGTLNATGIDGTPVHFTDLRDDSVGGDTNGDGPSSGAPGGWNGILVNGSASLAFSSIRYATTNVTKFGAGILTISNSQISNASGAGISISATAGGHSITGSTITNNSSDGLRFTGNSGTISVSGNNIITGNSGSGIYSDSAALTLQNNSITGNSGYALNLSGGTLSAPITGNTFSGNTAGAFRLMAEHLQPLSAVATSEKIVIAGGGITSTTILNAATPYVVDAIFAIGATTGILTVPAGTVVKFAPGTGIDVSGALNAGAAGNMAYFTDLRDDSVGGDTNGDGPSAGVPGGWRGILHTSGNTTFDNSTVRFGIDNISSGYLGTGSISISNSVVSNASARGIQFDINTTNLSVVNSTVSYNGADGIQLANSTGAFSIIGNTISYNSGMGISAEGSGTNPAVRNNVIAKNAVGVYAASGALPVIGGSDLYANSIFQNSAYGVQNAGTTAINATNNWWGSSTGPRHTSNPTGTGNAVSNLVTFLPYRTTQTFTEPVATFNPELFDFKRVRVGASSTPQNILITNVGSQSLTFGTLLLSGMDPTEFQITADNCSGASIAPAASCSITVTFTPTAKQGFSARLDFPASGASIVPLYSVALTGTGFTPVALPFWDDFSGSISPDWTIINPTATPYSLLPSQMIGTDNEVGLVRVATSATNLFGPTTNAYNIFTLALPTGVAKLMVTTKMNFQYPPVLDQYQGGIIILPEQNSQPDLTNFIRTQYGFWGSAQSFQTTTNVNASGTDYPGPQAPAANWYWLRLIKSGSSYKSLYSTDGVTFTSLWTGTIQQEAAYAGFFALNVYGRSTANVDFGYFEIKSPIISPPATLEFGNVPFGTTPAPQQNLTIANTGLGDLVVSSLSTPNLFTIGQGTCGTLPITIAEGSSCDLTVTMLTATLGAASATLAIGSDDIDNPIVFVTLSGTVVTAPTNLSVGFLGTGGGTVRHAESGAVCNTNCSVISTDGATATFTATPAEFSLFTVWGGSCSGSGACSFTVSGTTGGVTATFDRDDAHSVKIEPASYFSSILGAYASAASKGATTIKTWGTGYTEPLLFNQGKNVLLDGGYNGSFTGYNGGMTTIQGKMTVVTGATGGRIDVRNIRIKADP